MRSHYDVLGIPSHATQDDIKQAYKEKLFAAHPDKSVPTNDTTVNAIQNAYATLRDPQSRRQYDGEFKQQVAKKGFDVTGDGLDTYLLDVFEEKDTGTEFTWHMDCPRCLSEGSIVLLETDLDECGTGDGEGGLMIVVQCHSCSLWIKVSYMMDECE